MLKGLLKQILVDYYAKGNLNMINSYIPPTSSISVDTSGLTGERE